MEKYKDVIIAAILLMIILTAHRSCRKSFNHDFIADSVAVMPKTSTHYIHIVDKGGYYTIQPDTLLSGQAIWTIGTNSIGAERLNLVKIGLEEYCYQIHDSWEDGITILDDGERRDRLVQSIRATDYQER